ncbi:MBL fold metallo-hydrolase [Halobacteria archaeon AArc-curdl1]|uniref:MBL fold metallo-hydrolase n=1 Tax=Natronosalvus hydrolyticus TaxID=2979988 RepID=A0AAP3E8A9_9EURY|nr:MBL fold metallo-hydrolase [Halobacteria archaeon AArc-curdl1]
MNDVERIAIRTPFQIGRVNCYAITRGGLTLIDPGPLTDDAYTELTDGLEALGYTTEDVDRVLITHPHIDHFGLADRVRNESGATICAHRDAVDVLADPTANFEREQAFFRPYLASVGVPEQLLETVITLPESYNRFREPVAVDRSLAEGDEIVLDETTTLEAIHTPGHAPASVCFLDRERKSAFTGDHVMADISPNPLLTLEPGTTDQRTRSLPDYLAALERIATEDVTTGYGGHREIVPDIAARVEEILAHHDKRSDRVSKILDDDGPLTPYEVMNREFPDLPATETFAGMSEIIGHLDVLEDAGRVERIENGPSVRYTLTEE